MHQMIKETDPVLLLSALNLIVNTFEPDFDDINEIGTYELICEILDKDTKFDYKDVNFKEVAADIKNHPAVVEYISKIVNEEPFDEA